MNKIGRSDPLTLQEAQQTVPTISIIVPVFDVEAYLPDCLDSILSQDYVDFEVIAVNDCSPDNSLEILRRYRQQDARVHIVDLAENVGLGGARNAGIDASAGKYLWFVDSDDSIAPGALRALAAKCQNTGAELVVFGWTRNHEDGRVRPGSGAAILAAAPRLFTALEYPPILHVLQIACNKLISRALLDRTNLRFFGGWYEDVPFNFSLLGAAVSLTAMPDPLLKYRQREESITRTYSDRHLEVIDQWDRAMQLVEAPEAIRQELRDKLFPVMLRHCTRVLLAPGRVPPPSKKEFLARLNSLYRRYLPSEGFQPLSRMARVQYRLLAFESPVLLKAYWRLTIWVRFFVHR